MKVIADLHIHSRFSRATSKNLNVPSLEKWAKIKGVSLLGTGDFTHPEWLEELKSTLLEDGSGVLRTESGFPFVLQTEIASIYTQNGKGRRVHNVILAPSFDVVEQIREELGKKGRLDYDGRPIFKLPCDELVEMMKGISRDVHIIPAHIWTPWFSVFGSKSGFDSMEKCFQDQTKHIFAVETGLSSDPEMNWRLSELDKYTLISNSDLHSFWPWRMGRESNVFELEKLTYSSLVSAIRDRDPKRFLHTIEVDPSYGKYHLDGHRKCDVCMEPGESLKLGNVCPKCGRNLTVGVLHRVEELADRPEGYRPDNAIPFKSLIPLSEVIGSAIGGKPATKKVWAVFNKLVDEFGSEFSVVLDAKKGDIEKVAGSKIADYVLKVRQEEVNIQPGYDGVYGKPVFRGKLKPLQKAPAGAEPKPVQRQKNLSDF